MALGGDLIDPVAFTVLRLISGAVVLVPLARFTSEKATTAAARGSWLSALGLFTYAIAFSLAYVSLTTGMGALILFGSVQATMISYGLWSGERPHLVQWLGMGAALSGLLWLLWPGVTAPDPLGALLMGSSGIAWGCYSIRGKAAPAPVAATAGNFARTLPMVAITGIVALSSLHAQPMGVLLALISGSVTSGLGYVLWYKVLHSLTTTRAAVLQLLVPVLAALAGVAFLAEAVTLRLLIATTLILGGVALVVRNKTIPRQGKPMAAIEGLRSCWDRVGGLFYFGRMLDKIRLHAAGRLPAEYLEQIGDGFDGRTVRYLHVDYGALCDQVVAGASDEAALAWCYAEGRQLTDEEILIFNSFMSKRGWRDDETDGYIPAKKQAYGFADDAGIVTDFDVIEADEGRPVDVWRHAWS